jgi:CBS domain-containing membrane protein
MRLVKDYLAAYKLNQTVLTLEPRNTFEDALHLIFEKKIRHVIVVDSSRVTQNDNCTTYGTLYGILSDRDLRVAINTPLLANVSNNPLAFDNTMDSIMKGLKDHHLVEIAKKDVICATEETTLKEAAGMMVKQRVGCLPIVKSGTKDVIGLITRTDMISLLADVLE